MKKSIYSIGGKLLNQKEQKSINGGFGYVIVGGCARIEHPHECLETEVCEWRYNKCDVKHILPPHIEVVL
ncbi:hypothetical protein [Tenacibaculum sp. M341]|uniref:hypothetical protein n=1 Tax=Tenacibaculum sp. M341 TaxID=2530339 RepID=UPI0010529E2A|nr:hypothetical protein [Tenacibaculum sp. M341]TCI91811.1 hypothetical protein EYW44_09670 [Tenacibaculum sp. M341]